LENPFPLDIFNYHIQRLKENGILKRIGTKWAKWDIHENIVAHGVVINGQRQATIGYTTVAFPFALLGVGIVASLVTASLESIFHRLVDRQT
jgi:hypothetical protein